MSWACCFLAIFMSLGGDFYLKCAAESWTWWRFVMSIFLYAGSTIPWYVVIRSMKLTQVAIIYPVLSIFCLTGMGVWIFGEHMGLRTWIALILSLAAIMTLEWHT